MKFSWFSSSLHQIYPIFIRSHNSHIFNLSTVYTTYLFIIPIFLSFSIKIWLHPFFYLINDCWWNKFDGTDQVLAEILLFTGWCSCFLPLPFTYFSYTRFLSSYFYFICMYVFIYLFISYLMFKVQPYIVICKLANSSSHIPFRCRNLSFQGTI